MNGVDGLFRTCAGARRAAIALFGLAVMLPAQAAAAPTAEALKEARQASTACARAKAVADEKSFADYKAAKERAIKADGSVVRELYAGRTTYGDLFAACDRDIPRALRLRSPLKGDRYSIWEREGDPDDVRGATLQSAASWGYRRTPAGTSFVCTITYVFNGNTLVKKSKSGSGCVLIG